MKTNETDSAAPAFRPWGLGPRCCDLHVDCDAVPREAVHRFMDPAAQRKNREAAGR